MSTDIFQRKSTDYLPQDYRDEWLAHKDEWNNAEAADKAAKAEQKKTDEAKTAVALKRRLHALKPYFDLIRLPNEDNPISLLPVDREIWSDLAIPFNIHRRKGQYGDGRYTYLEESLWHPLYHLGDSHNNGYQFREMTMQYLAKSIFRPSVGLSNSADQLEGYVVLPEQILHHSIAKPRKIERGVGDRIHEVVEPVLMLDGHMPFIRSFWDKQKKRYVWGVLFTEVVEWFQSTPTQIRDWSWFTNTRAEAVQIALQLAIQKPDLTKKERYVIPGGRTRTRGGISLAPVFAQTYYPR